MSAQKEITPLISDLQATVDRICARYIANWEREKVTLGQISADIRRMQESTDRQLRVVQGLNEVIDGTSGDIPHRQDRVPTDISHPRRLTVKGADTDSSMGCRIESGETGIPASDGWSSRIARSTPDESHDSTLSGFIADLDSVGPCEAIRYRDGHGPDNYTDYECGDSAPLIRCSDGEYRYICEKHEKEWK